jgi:hypothetical protein
MGEAVRHPELCIWPREVEQLVQELVSLEVMLACHNPCDTATLAKLRLRQRELAARIEAMKASTMAREGLA